jgi:DNA-binding response OmpR family regulator
MRILIIEDDPDIAADLYDYLEGRGHVVDAARDGVTGLHLAVSDPFDAIILDLGLPGLNGLACCRKLREEAQCDTPVLILTARDVLEDKLEGFASGADDYLVKPFALREVEARLTALAKRHQGRVVQKKLNVGQISLDPATCAVTVAGKPVKLSRKCLRLLEALMAHPDRVLSRADLEHAVWGDDPLQSDTLRSHMCMLRRVLTDAEGHSPIETVHGFGYRLATGVGHDVQPAR